MNVTLSWPIFVDFYGNNSWYPYSKLPLLQYSFKNLLLIIIDILTTPCNLINSSVTQSVWAAKQLRGFHCYWQLVPFCTLLSSILFLTLNRHTTPQFPRMLPFQQKFFLILKFCGNSHKAFVINCRNILINGYGLCTLEILMLYHQLSTFMTLPGLDIQFQPQTEEIWPKRKILRTHL